MKKKYHKPTVEVIEVKKSVFLCTSTYDPAPRFNLNEDEYELNNWGTRD